MPKKKSYPSRKLTNEEKAAKLTNKIIQQMDEDETVPWHKPWNVFSGKPRNFATANTYSGVNLLLLAMANFESPYFMGFGQARDMGGHVRKGEKGTPVYRPFTYVKKEERARSEKAGEEPQKSVGFTTETVFNASQIEGIDFPKPETIEFNNIEAAEKLSAHMVERMGIRVEHGKRAACYVPALDRVDLPNKENFHSEANYYSTLFHELAHATGHESRLDRGLTPDFSDEKYGVEELRAELTANYLRSLVGIEDEDQEKLSVSYLKAWKERIEADPEMFIAASKDAFAISEYLTEGFNLEEEVDVVRVGPDEEEVEIPMDPSRLAPVAGADNAGKGAVAALGIPGKEGDAEEGIPLDNPHISESDTFGRKELAYSYVDHQGKLHEERQPLFASEAIQMERYMSTFPEARIEATKLPIDGLDTLRSLDIKDNPSLEEVTEEPELIPELPEPEEEKLGVGEVDLDI